MADFDFGSNLTTPDVSAFDNPIGTILPPDATNEKNTYSDMPDFIPSNIGTRPGDGIFSFLSNFSKGFAKPNRFRIEMQLPPGVEDAEGSDGANDTNIYSQASQIKSQEQYFNKNGAISIKCHTANLPERILQTADIRQNGFNLRMPITAAYEPITFTFYLDGAWDTKMYLEIWQAAVVNFSNNTLNFFEEYVSDISIYTTDMLGDDSYGCTLYQAYPLGISNTELSYGNNNTMASISVTFAYKYWISQDSSQQRNDSTGN